MSPPSGGALRRALTATIVVVAWPWLATPVAAHAELAASSPAANASLAEPPDELRLEFTEPIDERTAEITIVDPEQVAVTGVGAPQLSEGGRVATLDMPSLGDGVYVVRYRVLSTVDGHVTGGSFAFGVDTAGVASPPSVTPTTEAPGADAASAAARWVALVGAIVAVGTVVFWLASARPATRAHGVSTGPPWGLLVLAGVATVGGLAAYLAWAGRDLPTPDGAIPFDLAAPYGATPFGIAMRVAMLGAVASLALGVVGWLRRRGDRHGSVVPWVLLAGGAVTLGGMSFAGHASALGGTVAAVFDLGHLVGVAVWLGPLPAFLALFLGPLRRLDAGHRRATAAAALRRHGRTALIAAPLVALTGIANSPVVLGGTRDLVATEYGNLVLAKAVLFSTAIGIGAVNFFLVRRLALRAALVTISAELAVAALAVLVAAGMLTVPVAASRAPRLVTVEVPTAHLYDDSDVLAVHAIVSVPSPGNQTYQAVVTRNGGGEPLDDLQRVFFTFVSPDGSELGSQRVVLEPAGPPGVFETTGAYTPVVGAWEVAMTVRRSGVPDESFSWTVDVREAPPPEQLPPADTGVGVPAPLGMLWRLVPPQPYEWLPPLALFGAAGVAWVLAPVGRRDPARRRPWIRARTGLVVAGVAAALVVGSQQLVLTANAGTDGVLPAENPVTPTRESVAAGEMSYRATCAGCHGADGRGAGPMAGNLDVRPSDLAVHVPFHTDGELYAFITRGISGTPMPGFATELSPEDRWDLVNYLRSRWPER